MSSEAFNARSSHERVKPRWRGYSHQYAFFAALIAGVLIIWAAPDGRARAAVLIYAFSVVALFGASALYHRVNWSVTARRWMRRLDHSMIFVLIAGTYTPFCLLALHGTLANVVLIVVWAGAFAGILMKLFWIDAPKWLVAAIYLGLGWVAVATFPQLADSIGAAGITLLGLGGLLYTVGAVIYALKRPDPSPEVFGYHEIFHLLVIAAAAAQYAAIAFYVLPRA